MPDVATHDLQRRLLADERRYHRHPPPRIYQGLLVDLPRRHAHLLEQHLADVGVAVSLGNLVLLLILQRLQPFPSEAGAKRSEKKKAAQAEAR